jgi:xanthine dehydrogenase accessory factor
MKNYVNDNLVVIRGGGDLGTGVAFTLFNAGFSVAILEIANPIAVRRKVAFSEAIYEKIVTVEGVTAVFTTSSQDILKIIGNKNISVLIDEDAKVAHELKPIALIDAIVAKKNFGTNKNLAPITIALGPGFIAGEDVDAVIETNRGENLGEIFYEGKTSANTRQPAPVMGFKRERVLWAPVSGYINVIKDIGDYVSAGQAVAEIKGVNIRSKIDGFLRGIVRSGIYLREGLKVADIDPRLDRVDLCYKISDKALLLGKSVLQAIKELKDKSIQHKQNRKIYAL